MIPTWAACLLALGGAPRPGAGQSSRPVRAPQRLAGEVLGPGGPVADAEVEASFLIDRDLLRSLPDVPARTARLTTRSDATGRFHFELPPGHAVRLTAHHGNLVALPRTEVRPGDPTVLRLLPACPLRIPGATAPAFAHALAFADEVGRWLQVASAEPVGTELVFTPGLPPGSYRLVAGDGAGRVIDQRLVLSPGEEQPPAPPWRVGAVLQGMVRMADATPLPAGLELVLAERPWTRTAVVDGRFRLAGIPATGALWEIQVRGPVRVAAPWWQPTRDGETRELTLTASRGRDLTVALRDARGTACGGALVLAFRRHADSSVERRASAVAPTDATGHAHLAALPAEPVLLLALAGAAGTLAHAETEPLAPSLELNLVDPALVQLLARDGSGAPIPGARVRLLPQEPLAAALLLQRDAFADRKGRAAFAGLPPGAWTVQVDAPPCAPRQGSVFLPPGAAIPLDWSLEPGLRLFGTVHDQAGRPVAGARVVLRPPDDPEERGLVTGPDGSFSFDGLLDQDYILFAARETKTGTESALLRQKRPAPEPLRMMLVHEDPTAVPRVGR